MVACLRESCAMPRALAYVCFEQEPGRRAAAKLLTRDEARRIAAELFCGPEQTRLTSASSA
jgi:hypothetical protein